MLSLLISYFALGIAKRKANNHYTFGCHRAEIVGALLSVFLIWLMATFLVVEAFTRLKYPNPIEAGYMVGISGIGVLVNVVLGAVLYENHSHHSVIHVPRDQEALNQCHDHHSTNMNIRAAFVHVLGDLIQSIGVLLAATLIWFKSSWTLIDPLCTLLFTALIIGSTGYLFKDIVNIIMEATPANLSIEQIINDVRSTGYNAADVHIWSLVPGKICCTMRVKSCSGHPQGIACITDMLQNKYNIMHTTIQVD